MSMFRTSRKSMNFSDRKPARKLALRYWILIILSLCLPFMAISVYLWIDSMKPIDFPAPVEVDYPVSQEPPVLPLTVFEDCGSISATRKLSYDFARCIAVKPEVSDTYTLTNTSSEDVTLTALYPFITNFDSLDDAPEITVNGQSVSASLGFRPFGPEFTSGKVSDLEVLLADPHYLFGAAEAMPVLDQKVAVYTVTNFSGVFEADDRALFTYTLEDPDAFMLLVENGYLMKGLGKESVYYFYVYGGELASYQVGFYEDENCNPGEEVWGECTITKSETTFGEILREMAYDHIYDPYFQLDKQLFTQIVTWLYDEEEHRTDYGYYFSILFSRARYHNLIFFKTFSVTIPAGESVTVSASWAHYFNIIQHGVEHYGLEVATKCGSNLRFVEQTLEIYDWKRFTPAGYDFHFDVSADRLVATISTERSSYYLHFTDWIAHPEEPAGVRKES